jgi:hypothetical protein
MSSLIFFYFNKRFLINLSTIHFSSVWFDVDHVIKFVNKHNVSYDSIIDRYFFRVSSASSYQTRQFVEADFDVKNKKKTSKSSNWMISVSENTC